AGLRGQGGGPLDVEGGTKGGAQVRWRVIETVNVRPHQADVVFAADRHQLSLHLRLAGFREAGRNQHGTGDLLLATLGQRTSNEFGRNRKDGSVDFSRNV